MELQWNFNEKNHHDEQLPFGHETTNHVVKSESDSEEFGLSIIPVGKNKQPFRPWAEYQSNIAPISLWHSHFINQGTVGIIAGKISGNLECIDIDLKNDPQKSIITEFNALIPDELLSRLLIQSTPSGGLHYIYRCPEADIDNNLKLALHSDRAVILETRGEGGYFCTSKSNNKILRGLLDLESLKVDIPLITPAERNFLLESARGLTRYFPTPETDTKNGKAFSYKEPAINEFNDKYNLLELFTKHGWSTVNEDDEKYYLLRDGSNASHSGYYFKATKTFFCFSTSTEFKSEKPYNHFQVLQVLEGKNDYRSTLRLLPALGFDVETSPKKIGADEIATYLNGLGIRYDSFIQDLTFDGKIVEELDYNTAFIDLKKHFDKEIPRTRFEETIKSHYITSVNPIQDFIAANNDRKPSGTFDKWLDCMTLKNKAIDRDIVLLFLKKWYTGMIAQALDGEYANEFFLTLLSTEQGIGKTTFLRKYTLPKELHGYRKEHSLSFDDDFKVMMSQALLIIDDEMDGRTYEQDKTFKNILSTKELTMRRKYDRRISTIKRRCSFAGSGNNLFVVREQQNRRIIPVEVEAFCFGKLAALDLNDLFMEAYNLYNEGFQYSYQRDDMALLKKIYDDYVQKSDVDVILDDYIKKPEGSEDLYYISNLDIVMCLSNKFPQFSKRINVVAIGKQMVERGFETARRGKQRKACYAISKKSMILHHLDNDSQSWRLNYGEYVGLK